MSTYIDVPIVQAFVDGERGGNPAGVVLEADRYSRAEKQAIAAAVGLSETAFVSRSTEAAFKLEFFTPNRQIAHCGHATIASFSYLLQIGLAGEGPSSKETIDGRREIWIENGMAFMEQRAPAYTELDADSHAAVLASLGIDAGALLPGRRALIVNTGNSFLLVPLRDAGAVKAVVPNQHAIGAISERFDLIGYYVFARDTEKPGRHAGARMFAPRYGIPEEAATGMAAGPLACLLHDHYDVPAEQPILIEQGYWMPQPSPSLIEVRLEREVGRIARLLAGGRASLGATRRVTLALEAAS